MNYKENYKQQMESYADEIERELKIESLRNKTPFDGGKYGLWMSMYADDLIREAEDLEMREQITRDELFEIEKVITDLT